MRSEVLVSAGQYSLLVYLYVFVPEDWKQINKYFSLNSSGGHSVFKHGIVHGINMHWKQLDLAALTHYELRNCSVGRQASETEPAARYIGAGYHFYTL